MIQKKGVRENQNHSNQHTHTQTHTHTHNYKHIKRKIKKAKVNTLQEKGTKTLIKINPTKPDLFILETGESSSLIEYPI